MKRPLPGPFYLTTALVFLLTTGAPPSGLAGDVTVVKTFPADSGPGYKGNPDNAGSVGPNHVVDFDGLNFVVHDKATGQVLLKKSHKEFWAAAEPANTLILPVPNDPRILYDPLSGRWFACTASSEAVGARLEHGYLAVSTTSDPTQPWKGVQLPMLPQDLGMDLGVDKNGLYISYCNRNTSTSTFHDCLAIPKADAIAPGGPDLTHLATFHDLQHESFPATDLDPNKAPTAPEVLLNKEFGNDCGKLYLYKITWTGTTASISEAQIVPLSRTYSTPNGNSQKNLVEQPAPGGKLRADEGRRTSCAFAHGGSVFGCNDAKRTIDSQPGILWYEVRVSDGHLLQEGFVDDPTHGYLSPSLAVDADGNVGIGCTRSSTEELPSIYVMLHAATDPAGTTRKPVLAVPGTVIYSYAKGNQRGIPWGNYSSTCLDPANPKLFWTLQEYANSSTDGQWSAAWVAFHLDSPSATAAPPAK
jgi:hypothetical protein